MNFIYLLLFVLALVLIKGYTLYSFLGIALALIVESLYNPPKKDDPDVSPLQNKINHYFFYPIVRAAAIVAVALLLVEIFDSGNSDMDWNVH